jgi:hypothetical protein
MGRWGMGARPRTRGWGLLPPAWSSWGGVRWGEALVPVSPCEEQETDRGSHQSHPDQDSPHDARDGPCSEN